MAQMKPIGEVATDSFPVLGFRINHRDPRALPASAFTVEDAGKEMKFQVEATAPNDSGQTRDILILWELLPAKARDAQNKFFRQVILSALPRILGEGDRVNVATFAWTDQAKGEKTLSPLMPDFTNDTASLAKVVGVAKAPGGKGIDNAHGSELYPALKEGIGLLAPSRAAKVLLVLSAEFPNIFNPGGEVGMVTAEARKADVAVYNLRYQQMAPKYNLDDVAKNTYGLSMEVAKDRPGQATDTLVGWSRAALQRSLGMDYAFTLTTESPRDGKTHSLHVKAGTETLELNYTPPGLGLGGWIKENLVLFIVVVVLLLAAAGGLVWWLRRRRQQEEARIAEEQRKLEEVQARGRETEDKLSQQRQQVERMQREEQDKQRRADDAKRKEAAEAERQAMLKEMFANGKQPRITAVVGGKPVTIELPSHVTTVGRDAGCDLQIADPTISRTHFQIIYQDRKYLLVDLGSTNGTLLNGHRVTSAELRHGDQIKAGEAILSFYI